MSARYIAKKTHTDGKPIAFIERNHGQRSYGDILSYTILAKRASPRIKVW